MFSLLATLVLLTVKIFFVEIEQFKSYVTFSAFKSYCSLNDALNSPKMLTAILGHTISNLAKVVFTVITRQCAQQLNKGVLNCPYNMLLVLSQHKLIICQSLRLNEQS